MDPEDGQVIVVGTNAESIRLALRLPNGYMYLPDMHHHLNLSSSDDTVISVPPFGLPDLSFDWKVPVRVGAEGEAVLHLEGQVFFCPVTDRTVCIYATIDEVYPVRVEEMSDDGTAIIHDIEVLDHLLGAHGVRTLSVGQVNEK